ncbi:hypothetical protein DXA10_03085 [Firmicutes bacterium AM55-24TS]|nr:hypothetical protein DXA10_03085 [Firmicutes bacterium AM55-24TS]
MCTLLYTQKIYKKFQYYKNLFYCIILHRKYIKSFNIIKIYFTVSYYAGEKQAKHMAKCKVT